MRCISLPPLAQAVVILLCLNCFVSCSSTKKNESSYKGSPAAITLSSPLTRIVYQRDNNDEALVHIVGFCPVQFTVIEARLVAREKGRGTSTKWVAIDTLSIANTFDGTLQSKGGWYNLEVRASTKKRVVATATLERVGIGEVFIVVGHSVAQGGDINIEGATDDRVSVVPVQNKSERFETYLKNGNPDYLPEPVFANATSGVAPAPFGSGSYFWSKFGSELAEKENVPVLIFNAGFGGTNLEHWAKASQGEQFEHGFVKSSIRMPYINLVNTYKKYIPLTGLRALLADHGQNDWRETDPEKIFQNYKTFVKQARADLGYPQLAIVVNQATPPAPSVVRGVQERMLKEPYCFSGPDYNRLVKADRYDDIHLSAAGEEKAADMWTAALTPAFFSDSKPYLPDFSKKTTTSNMK